MADGGPRTVSWVHVERVGQRKEPLEARAHVLRRAVREIRPTDRAPEDQVAGEQESLRAETHAPRGVPGRVEDLEPDAGEPELVAVAERADVLHVDRRRVLAGPPVDRIR